MEPKDLRLMASVQEARPDAFEALYDRYSRLTFSLAVRVLGDPQTAEECVQEAFLSVWRRAATYDEEDGSVRAWILSLVHDRAVDRVRVREGRQRGVLPRSAAPEERRRSDPCDATASPISDTEIRGALGALTDEQRSILELAYFGGCSPAEIGDRLRVPLATVQRQTRVALRSLRGALA